DRRVRGRAVLLQPLVKVGVNLHRYPLALHFASLAVRAMYCAFWSCQHVRQVTTPSLKRSPVWQWSGSAKLCPFLHVVLFRFASAAANAFLNLSLASSSARFIVMPPLARPCEGFAGLAALRAFFVVCFFILWRPPCRCEANSRKTAEEVATLH